MALTKCHLLRILPWSSWYRNPHTLFFTSFCFILLLTLKYFCLHSMTKNYSEYLRTCITIKEHSAMNSPQNTSGFEDIYPLLSSLSEIVSAVLFCSALSCATVTAYMFYIDSKQPFTVILMLDRSHTSMVQDPVSTVDEELWCFYEAAFLHNGIKQYHSPYVLSYPRNI